jgi:hypothetical protein
VFEVWYEADSVGFAFGIDGQSWVWICRFVFSYRLLHGELSLPVMPPTNAPPDGVLTLLVTPPPSLPNPLSPDPAPAPPFDLLIGSECSTLGDDLPVVVFALDLFLIKLGIKLFRGEVGLTSGPGLPGCEPSARGYWAVGRAICVGLGVDPDLDIPIQDIKVIKKGSGWGKMMYRREKEGG